MELSLYDVLLGTVITPKSLALRKKLGKITFKVNPLANKIMVRAAVEKLFDAKVRDVRILITKGKTKMIKRKSYKMASKKKAIVTLKPGYKIDLPDQFESMAPESMPAEGGK